MNRRSFFKTLGIGGAVTAVAPKLKAIPDMDEDDFRCVQYIPSEKEVLFCTESSVDMAVRYGWAPIVDEFGFQTVYSGGVVAMERKHD